MAQKWTINRYHRFLKAAKSKYGLTHRQSQELYRKASSKLGKAPTIRDIAAHPLILSKLSKTVTAGRIGKRGGELSGRGTIEAPSRAAGGGGGGGGGTSINSPEKWQDYLDDYDLDPADFDYIEYDSSADYGEE